MEDQFINEFFHVDVTNVLINELWPAIRRVVVDDRWPLLVVDGFWIEFNFWIYSHEVNFHHTHVLDIYSTSSIDVIWRNLISEEFQQIALRELHSHTL